MRLFLLLTFSFLLHAKVLDINIAPKLNNQIFMHIKILDQKELLFSSINGVRFAELSDIAYDPKSKRLYFIGDKGMLYVFHAKFSTKIDRLQLEESTMLKDKKSKLLKLWRRDAEGLTLDNKGRLLISFEGEAKIAWFHKNGDKIGSLIRKYRLPKCLRVSSNYRSPNKSLESLAWHKQYGILTACEWPLKKEKKHIQTIYSLSGEKWRFQAEPEENTAVVAIEVMDDGNLLILERSFSGIFNPFVITLKKVMINNCMSRLCPTKVLAKMSNHKGWAVDNFEGLAKVGKNRYVMVSDDGNNFFEKTLLIYFEVL